MRQLSILLLFLSLSLKLVAFSNDSLTLIYYHIDTNFVSQNIVGSKFTFTFEFNSKNTNSIKSTSSKIYSVSLKLLDELQQQIKSTNSQSRYNLNGLVQLDDFIVCNDTTQNKLSLFLPHYILKINTGLHKLTAKLIISEYDITTKKYSKIIDSFNGKSIFDFTINKPTSRSFQIYCSGVKIDSTNARSWDVGLIGYPDLIYKVSLVSGFYQFDCMAYSTEMQNSLSAAWIDYSKIITISNTDKITISIYDKDTIASDLIGEISMSLDQLINHSDSMMPLKFGSVNYCTFKVKEIAIK